KFFGADGTKLGEEQEREIERLVAAAEPEAANGRVRELHGAVGDYLRELHARFSELDLSGRSYLLDCANGATYLVAPEIFRRLGGDGVAVTVMTNYGFHQAMKGAGVKVATTPVGDRHVLAELIARGWALGGEQSGHIIDTGFVPSGDGIASALLTLEALGDRD